MEGAYDDIISEATKRLMRMVTHSVPEDACTLLGYRYRDPITPFIKDEPHPKRKWEEGHWRIVSCVSLVDQLVERAIYSRVVCAIKGQYPFSAAVIGIGFTDQQASEFASHVGVEFVEPKGVDISQWDRDVGVTHLRESAENIIRKAEDQPPAYALAVRNHIVCNTHPVFLIRSPTCYLLVVRVYPGGMLSGSFVTTLYNTLCRIDVAYLSGALEVKAAGDDAIEERLPSSDVEAEYAKLGFKARLEPSGPDFFDFCSHRFSLVGEKVIFLSWRKAVTRYFMRGNYDVEHTMALYYEMRHNEELPVVRSLVAQVQAELVSSKESEETNTSSQDDDATI